VNDLFVYRVFTEPVLDGGLPYRDVFLEYPPLAAPAIGLPGLLGTGEEVFRWAFAGWTFLLASAVVILCGALAARTGGDARRALLAAALMPLLCGSLVRTHFDLAPVGLLLGALLLLATGRPRSGMAVLGLAAMTKGFPLVAAPVALAWLAARVDRRTLVQSAAALLAALALPAGAAVALGGVTEDQNEAFQQLGLAMLAAIAIVFIIMVATFRSLIQPLILLVSVPFAATGAIALLLVTDTALGVPALIGVLMLIGIVVTNAIVLLDLINQYREQGMSVREAVVEGGRRRLRPILMTAVATICALLPMALGITGEGGFISRPLAVVVIGGLVSSTLLTLVLVPTLYTMVEGRRERKRLRRQDRPDGAGPVPADATDGGRHRIEELQNSA
jgi:hypothetical protein